MRRFKRILKWSMFPLIIELLLLFYANNFYLTQNLKFSITKETGTESKIDFSKIKVPIPDNATLINASYDGRYVSYLSNGVLKVINSQDNSEESINFPSNIKATYYRWLPDRDRLLIAEKNNSGYGTYYYTISYYDTREKERVELSTSNGKTVKMPIPSSKYDVDSIALSTLTNATFIRISEDGIKNKIYRIDAMSEIENFLNNNYKIGTIDTLNRNDKFIYEDLTNKRIGIIGNGTTYISDIINPYILGIDSNDNLYIGSARGTKVTTIFYRAMDSSERSWKTIKLSEPTEKDDIYITDKGNIYINDNFRGILKDIKTGKEIKYTGTFLSIVNGGILTLQNGKVRGESIQ